MGGPLDGYKYADSPVSISTGMQFHLGAKATKMDFSAGYVAGETKKGLYGGEAGLVFNVASPEKDLNYRYVGGKVGLDYTTDEGRIFDFSVGADVEAGYGCEYNGGNKQTLDYGQYFKPGYTNQDGEVIPGGLTYGPVFITEKNPITNRKGKGYVAPSLNAGIHYLHDNDGTTSLTAAVGKDLVSGDTFSKVGAEYRGTIEGIFGSDYVATWGVGAEYTFNKNNRTSNIMNDNGLALGASINIAF